MRLAELQERFARTVLAGGSERELLALLTDPADQRERRLAVNRNNVRHALLSVLEAAFPVVRQLVGVECFTATALAFVARHPPRRPVLYEYGGHLPGFLADFQPLAELPWLADVARLEWARNEALFAAEREPLTPAQLAAAPPARLGELHLRPHPSARLLESPWPIHAIWHAHQPAGEPLEAVDLSRAESVLVWRQKGAVRQRSLAAGEFALLAAFAENRRLAEAVEIAAGRDSMFDFPAALARLLGDELLVLSVREEGYGVNG
ncbi:MAG TPA: DNA-binding domain-containing protein [Candidatus Competibacter sp.]|nr:DUF2063 domain-containing protein [Candidatus Competibacteraceae bacterium]HRC73848.1 DNA-binding domain-containing protein [Candidatus Competibacter sp.]